MCKLKLFFVYYLGGRFNNNNKKLLNLIIRYVYIYREREREREILFLNLKTAIFTGER